MKCAVSSSLHPSQLRIYYQNAGGLRTKTNEIFISSSAHDYDVIILTETWLKPDIYSSELFDSSYVVYRMDRSLESGMERGGGVLIAVRSSLDSQQLNLPTISFHFEQVCVLVRSEHILNNHNGFEYCFIVNYIRPKSNLELYVQLVSNVNSLLMNLSSNQFPCIFGDFNLGDIDWRYLDDDQILVPFNVSKDVEIELIDNFSSLGLIQINFIKNCLNRVLDLIFVLKDLKYMVSESNFPLVKNQIHHKAIDVIFEFYQFQSVSTDNCNHFNFKKADFMSLNNYFNSINWEHVLFDKTLEQMYTIFKTLLFEGVQQFVPIARKRSSFKSPWFNKRLKNLENVKNKALKKCKASGKSEDRTRFMQLRREFDFLSRFLYSQYISTVERNIKCNSKSFWVFFKFKTS